MRQLLRRLQKVQSPKLRNLQIEENGPMLRKKIPITNNDDKEVETATLNNDETGTPQVAETEAAYIIALQADLEESRIKSEEAEKRVLYVQADFLNFKRRKEEESKDIQRFANAELLKKLLPVVDSLQRALAAAEQTRNIDSILTGLAGTLKQLDTYLDKAGVTPIESVGHEFDPTYHEAIAHTESDAYPPHTVAEEVQRGYMINDRVLRPALVKVTEG
jgi:molecular chaperone GrpE